MRTALKDVKQKTCKACGEKFAPMFNTTQVVCSPKCALAMAPANSERASKAIAQLGRREIKVRKEALKSRGDHLQSSSPAPPESIPATRRSSCNRCRCSAHRCADSRAQPSRHP